MSQIPLEDMPCEVIKAYILNPENSPLPERYTVHKLPLNTIKDLTRALIANDEINEQEAAEIMNS